MDGRDSRQRRRKWGRRLRWKSQYGREREIVRKDMIRKKAALEGPRRKAEMDARGSRHRDSAL